MLFMENGNSSTVASSALDLRLDFEAIAQKIRSGIEPARAHAISLHDEKGDLLWLSEDSMGPDEHGAVHTAVETFGNKTSSPLLAHDLGAARSAVCMRVTNSQRKMVGIVMLVVDTKGIKQDASGIVIFMTPKLQEAIDDFASTRPSTPSATTVPTASAPPSTSRVTKPTTRPIQPAISPHIDRLNDALRRSPIALYVQRLVPLTKGSRLQRYEILLRSKSESAPNVAPTAMLKAAVDNGLGSMIDRRVLTELTAWLLKHPNVWQENGIMFSVNLTETALHDEHFIKFVELILAKSGVPKGTIAFEIDVPTAVKPGTNISEVARQLNDLGCPLILDDFAMRTESFDLLRLPGVRFIKLVPTMTAQMRTDKISQAAISAVVQMSRVLGMHTVAKRTESVADQEWLTALGVDFVQSNSAAPPVAIESLENARRPLVGSPSPA